MPIPFWSFQNIIPHILRLPGLYTSYVREMTSNLWCHGHYMYIQRSSSFHTWQERVKLKLKLKSLKPGSSQTVGLLAAMWFFSVPLDVAVYTIRIRCCQWHPPDRNTEKGHDNEEDLSLSGTPFCSAIPWPIFNLTYVSYTHLDWNPCCQGHIFDLGTNRKSITKGKSSWSAGTPEDLPLLVRLCGIGLFSKSMINYKWSECQVVFCTFTHYMGPTGRTKHHLCWGLFRNLPCICIQVVEHHYRADQAPLLRNGGVRSCLNFSTSFLYPRWEIQASPFDCLLGVKELLNDPHKMESY